MGATHQALLMLSPYLQPEVLLHFDGANGATTTIDSSGNSHAVTVLAGSSLTTSQTQFGPSSLNLPGSGGVTSAMPSTITGAFCAEAWVRTTNFTGVAQGIISFGSSNWELFLSNNAALLSLWNGSSTVIASNIAPTVNVFTHCFLSRDSSGVCRVGMGGAIYTVTTYTNNSTLSTNSLMYVGKYAGGGDQFRGQTDEVRLVLGTPVYTGVNTYTVPTAPFLPA